MKTKEEIEARIDNFQNQKLEIIKEQFKYTANTLNWFKCKSEIQKTELIISELNWVLNI